VQKPLTSGPLGWSIGPTMQPLKGCLGGDALQETVIRNPRPTVGGDRAPWPTSHVARLASQHLVCYQLNQVGNSSCDSYKYPPTDGIQHTHHILEIPLAKLPFLV
jgi:hypothetical protein